jgi:hypothetical protein
VPLWLFFPVYPGWIKNNWIDTAEKTLCGEKTPGDNEMVISILNRRRFFTALTLFSMILTTLSGCAMSNYGKLESNPEIKQAFATYQILPNHKYYFRGVKSRPTVIVGINENYELNLKMWVQIDPESEDFRLIIDRVSLQGMGGTVEPWGFRILDAAGNDVGVWYSALSNAAVQINENRQITNLQPSRTVAIGDQRK